MQMKSGFEQATYAILLLHRCTEGETMPVDQLSGKMNVSPSYLQKLMRQLVQADLIVSAPGAKGGFRLNPAYGEITLFDIYIATEGKQSLFSPNGVFEYAFPSEEANGCILTAVMMEAEASWKEKLKSHTISNLDKQLN